MGMDVDLDEAMRHAVLLKPMTPQNIVIGGASGAMPPASFEAMVTSMTP